VQRQIETVLESLGYQVELGPEVETEWYNFEALNISAGHPARENWDSFYFTPQLLLRAHTSPAYVGWDLDVTDQDSVNAFVADVVERYGRLDVLVNAAGRLDEADTVRFSELDTAAASTLLQVDVIGAMRMCHAVRPIMLQGGGGAIVNFSSTYGNGTNPENAINFVPVTYSTAKGAIRGFTTTLARDLAPEIRVNALAPGPISGEWETEWGVSPEHIDEAIAMNPLKRFGKPEEIAETVLFLASDGAGYITGQVIHVDGGWVVAG